MSEHRGAIPASAMTATDVHPPRWCCRSQTGHSGCRHAAGIVPSHCVVTEFKDTKALSRAAGRASRELGYTRMEHSQIRSDAIIEAFAPLTYEVDDAVEFCWLRNRRTGPDVLPWTVA